MSLPEAMRKYASRIQVTDSECWEWTGKRRVPKRGRYGVVYAAGRECLAHRFFYELLVGRIPDGLTLDHLCRNPPCCNPAHLEPVTRGENVRRGIGPSANNARKTHCVHGHSLADAYRYQGFRECRTCKLARSQSYRDKKRGAA